ncbi:MAG: DUF2628 domain-containing protein [Rhizobiaceae bacterium]|nr:DUF2628 domain-containing protein [Rhizobiaceae bacterium]
MASYVVMEPPGRSPGDVRFVRDGFSVLALIFPVIWLLWHRLWIEALVIFAAALCIGAAGELSGWSGTAMAISFLLALYVALEGPELRIRALGRRGWQDAGVIDAADEDEAMTRYVAGRELPPEAEPAETRASYVAAPSGAPALGLLAYPTRR